MQSKLLGRSDCMVPEVGMGTYLFTGGAATLRAGIDAGAAFIDTTELYGKESVVGEAIRGQRNAVFVATKIAPVNFRHADVLAAADNSLRRLGTTHIDLYQLHQPSDDVPIEETMGAMEDLVDAGKIRFIGVSNFSVDQLRQAQSVLRSHRIASNQVRYNVADRTIEGGLLDYCVASNITVIAYSPLARGMHYLFDCDPRGLLHELADKYGKTPAQIALNWCLRNASVLVIPKGNSIRHVTENCGASDWRLQAEDLRQLETEFRFRRRSNMELTLRKIVPRGVKRFLKHTVARLPPGLRRRFD